MTKPEVINDAMAKRRTILWRMGERFAADYLAALGWTIVSQNWRSGRNEIDIIGLTRDGLLVFVEVKTRITSAEPGVSMYGLESITYEKRHKLLVAANIYLHNHNLVDNGARLDVIVVSYPRKESAISLSREELDDLDERTLRNSLGQPFATHIEQAIY